MKPYFEYTYNDDVRKMLVEYYEGDSLEQHSTQQDKKTALKLKRILAAVDFKPTDTVLDVGCAHGTLLTILSDKIKCGKGLDISQTVLEQTKSNNTKENLTFSSYNGTELELTEEIDKITLLDVLEHAFEPDVLVKNIQQALRPGGYLIVEVPFTGWLSELVYGEYHQGHLRYYDPEYLQKYLEGYGFEMTYTKTYNSVPFAKFWLKIPLLWNILDATISLIAPHLYPYFGSIIMVVKKQ